MPEELAIPILPDVNLDTEPYKFGVQDIDKSYALKLVNTDFANYETYRRTNHDPRWNGNDALYCAYMPQKFWEGSKIPKASHSQPLVFSQIETALPIIEQALFGSSGAWFQVEPEPGADANEARAIQAHLLYRLEHDKDDLGRTARREIDMAIKSLLTYGNGGVKVYYDPLRKKPCIEWVDIRDIFVDPGCPTPSIDDARSLIQRKYYTVEELYDMRDLPGMDIPEKAYLASLAKRPTFSSSDQTKTTQEAFRGVNFTPGVSDYAANPADRKIEVLLYYSKTRIIWVLGREWVAYTGPNPYGFIPFTFAPCFTFLSRFYALSYPDVLGDSQRYAEALFNARLNELSLALNPPKVKKAGGLLTPASERYFPGAVFQVNNPKEDITFQPPPSITTNIMGDVGFILQGSEKVTGVNGGATGNFSAGNVNRTAGGVQAQVAGASSRIYYIIKNIEDYLIVPMLYKLYKLIQFHTDNTALLPALGPNDEKIQVGGEAFQRPMQFSMIAASRMMSREKLLQILPVINQYFMNGAFLGQLHQAGKTVDFDEFQQVIQDATGTARQYKLIRPLTPQEQQAMNQPSPDAQMQMQQKQMDLQNRVQLQGMKSQTVIQKAQIDTAPDQLAIQQAQMEQVRAAQEAQLQLASKQAQAQADAQRKQQEMIFRAMGKQQELRAKEESDRQKAIQAAQTHAQKIQQALVDHEVKLRQSEEQNAEKLRAARLLAALKAKESLRPAGSEEE